MRGPTCAISFITGYPKQSRIKCLLFIPNSLCSFSKRTKFNKFSILCNDVANWRRKLIPTRRSVLLLGEQEKFTGWAQFGLLGLLLFFILFSCLGLFAGSKFVIRNFIWAAKV